MSQIRRLLHDFNCTIKLLVDRLLFLNYIVGMKTLINIAIPDEKLFELFKDNCEKWGTTPSIENFNYFKKGFYSPIELKESK